jgi:hypothetical protein
MHTVFSFVANISMNDDFRKKKSKSKFRENGKNIIVSTMPCKAAIAAERGSERAVNTDKKSSRNKRLSLLEITRSLFSSRTFGGGK